MGKDACEEPSVQTDLQRDPPPPPFPLWAVPQGKSVVGCVLSTLDLGLCFSAMGGIGSQGSASSQGQLLTKLQGAPFNCMTCRWHPLEPSNQQETPVCLGNRGACLGKGPRAISLGAGRERTFTGFLPSRGTQTSDWMLRTDLPFPSACRSRARGEMGTASAGPCPRQPASTGFRGRGRVGAGRR